MKQNRSQSKAASEKTPLLDLGFKQPQPAQYSTGITKVKIFKKPQKKAIILRPNSSQKRIHKDNVLRLKRFELKQKKALMLLKEEEESMKLIHELKQQRKEQEKSLRKIKAEERLKLKEQIRSKRQQEWKQMKKVEIKQPIYINLQKEFENKEEIQQQRARSRVKEERKQKYRQISKKEREEFASRIDQIIEDLSVQKKNNRA